MNRHAIARVFAVMIGLIATPEIHASKAIERLVYDVKAPGQFCWLEKTASNGNPLSSTDVSAILAGTKQCPTEYVFDKQTDFFRSGAVVQLFVIHGKLRSVFNITANGTEIQPELPQIRGIPDAQPAQTSPAPGAVTKGGGPEIDQLSDDAVRNYPNQQAAEREIQSEISKLQTEYLKAKASSAMATRAKSLILGVTPANLQSLPGFTLSSVMSFADALASDAQSKVSQKPFTDRAAFDSLADRCDSLVEGVRGLNSRLAASKVSELTTSAQTDADTLKASAAVAQVNLKKITARFSGQSVAGEDAIRHYLPSGDKYVEIDQLEASLQAGVDDVPKAVDTINSDLQSIFNDVNTIYENSRTPKPFMVLIGQWAKNNVVRFELREVPGFKHYGFGDTGDVQLGQGQQNQPQPGAVAVHPAAALDTTGKQDNSTTTKDSSQKPGDTQQSKQTASQTQGTLLETDSFNVHQFFRANVVSGFFASTLHNRDYGVTQIQGTGSQTVTVATVGNVTQPQLHYFVGLNYYFKQRDLFPGALKTSDYFIPGGFFGYGLDATNNFLVGPNWETKWGINVGFGAHIGSETFLKKGIVPGTTPLGSNATSPPTVSRPKLGTYVSVGFDLSVFKSVFGQLTGSSGSDKSPTTPSAPK
jgi:hypothetical protein